MCAIIGIEMMLMNLIISKSKNSKSLYIQKSFRKNGKSTSKVVKKLGTMEELLPMIIRS